MQSRQKLKRDIMSAEISELTSTVRDENIDTSRNEASLNQKRRTHRSQAPNHREPSQTQCSNILAASAA